MNEGPKEPLSFKVLLRYKFTIAVIAAVVIIGGYLRIVTEPSRYSATARIKVRFSSEVLSLPQVVSNVRTPILEEEVKAFMTLLRDPTFIDHALQDLERETEKEAGNALLPPPEPVVEEEPGAVEIMLRRGLDILDTFKAQAATMMDRVLFVEDTMVSARERRVLGVLARLSVEAGVDASHIITLTYRDQDPNLASKIANAITYKFIAVQKAKTRRRDEERLLREVDASKENLERVIRQKFRVAKEIGHTTLERAIEAKEQRLEQLRKDEAMTESALRLLEKRIIPANRDLPISVNATDSQVERSFADRMLAMLGEQVVAVERTDQILKQMDQLEQEKTRLLDIKISDLKAQFDAHLEWVKAERAHLLNDDTVLRYSPEFSSLQVEEQTAQSRLLRAEQEFVDGQQFNKQLAEPDVAEYVALWQEAKAPPFPDQQRRLLKLIVICVLGIAAGFGTAMARHLLWPKPAYRMAGGSIYLGDELDVPVVVLPEDHDDELESDLEFDMTFPEEESKEGAST